MMQIPSDVDRMRDVWRIGNGMSDDDGPEAGSFKVTNDGRPKVYVFGMIGGWRMNVQAMVRAIHEIRAPEIDLHVNSPGGFVWDGVALFEALRSHPARVIGHVDGLAASAASFLVQAADERVMARGSRMAIHDAQGGGYGSPAEIQRTVDVLNAVSDDIASIYADRAGGTRASWRKAMAATTSYGADQAVDSGLADRVAGIDRKTSGANLGVRMLRARAAVALEGVST